MAGAVWCVTICCKRKSIRDLLWWTEITNFFVSRASTGFVEGLNKLKALKRQYYGLFNLGNLFQPGFFGLEDHHLLARDDRRICPRSRNTEKR